MVLLEYFGVRQNKVPGKERPMPSEPTTHLPAGFTARRGQPLIGVPIGAEGEEAVRYFTSEDDADQALARDRSNIERALSAIGAWKHMDEEDGPDMLDELDRMRHETGPTPLFEL
jgi:hypothetical protein